MGGPINLAEFDADVVVDARDCIVGRIASEVAQRTLVGGMVAVVNAEDAVITGSEEDMMAKYRKRVEVGSDQGPHYPKRPDHIFKCAIRGMLPYKRPRGHKALSNVHVYVGNSYGEGGEMLEDTSLDRLSSIKSISLGEVSKKLGANVTW